MNYGKSSKKLIISIGYYFKVAEIDSAIIIIIIILFK